MTIKVWKLLLLGLLISTTTKANTLILPKQSIVSIDGPIFYNGNLIVKEFKKIKTKDSVWLLIDSTGGAIAEMWKIVRHIKLVQARGIIVNCLVTGTAQSAAFHILTECDSRYGIRYSTLMFHESRFSNIKNATLSKVRKVMVDLLAYENQVIPMYTKALNVSKKKFMLHYLAGHMWTIEAFQDFSPNYIKIVDNYQILDTQQNKTP